jgi:hypothetical protein
VKFSKEFQIGSPWKMLGADSFLKLIKETEKKITRKAEKNSFKEEVDYTSSLK